MCGILSGLVLNICGDLDGHIHAAGVALRNRGPNDRGTQHFQLARAHLFLGHTRLSVIDLTSGGHQPMSGGDGRYVIVFNGEIYNYKELREGLSERGRGLSRTRTLKCCSPPGRLGGQLACHVWWACSLLLYSIASARR